MSAKVVSYWHILLSFTTVVTVIIYFVLLLEKHLVLVEFIYFH